MRHRRRLRQGRSVRRALKSSTHASAAASPSLVKRGDLRGKTGDAVLLADLSGAPCERVIVLGLGNRSAFKRKQYRKALASALAVLARTGANDAVSYLGLDEIADADAYSQARIAVEVVAASHYRIPDHKTSNKRPKPSLTKFGIAVAESRRQGPS